MKQVVQNSIIVCLILLIAFFSCKKDEIENPGDQIEENDTTGNDTTDIIPTVFNYSFFPYFEGSVFQFEKIYSDSDGDSHSKILFQVESFYEDIHTAKVISSEVESGKESNIYYFRKTVNNKIEFSSDSLSWEMLLDINSSSTDYSFLFVGKPRIPSSLYGNLDKASGASSHTIALGTFATIKNQTEYDANTYDSYIYSDEATEHFNESIGIISSHKTYVDWSVGYPYIISFSIDVKLTGYKIHLLNGDILEDGAVEDESTIPIAPENLIFDRTSGTSVSLEWEDASLNESGFEIERREYEDGDFELVATTAINENTFIDNIESSKKYQYRVRAKNAAGNSDYTNIVDVNIYGVPGAPFDIDGYYDTDTYKIHLNWWVYSNDEINHFVIAMYDNGNWVDLGSIIETYPTNETDGKWQQNAELWLTSGDPFPSGTYSFKTKAINSYGESFYSEQVDVIVAKSENNSRKPDFTKIQLIN